MHGLDSTVEPPLPSHEHHLPKSKIRSIETNVLRSSGSTGVQPSKPFMGPKRATLTHPDPHSRKITTQLAMVPTIRGIHRMASVLVLPSGNQTWLENPRTQWRTSGRKIIDKSSMFQPAMFDHSYGKIHHFSWENYQNDHYGKLLENGSIYRW